MHHHPTNPLLLATIEELVNELQHCRHCYLLYDEHIPEKVRLQMCQALTPKSHFSLPGSDEVKNISVYEKVVAWLLQNEAIAGDRLVVAGGGALTDLGGFVASTYHRGMKLVFVPSTLLGMVDACVGGKNGINLGGVKNVLGTIYQPNSILICPGLLASFTHNELLFGLPEMIKHAILDSEEHFHAFEELLASWSLEELVPLITRSVEFKCKIIERWTKDSPVRDLLNLGHTVGHAIEACLGPKCPHGSAVYFGLLVESTLGVQLGITDESLLMRLQALTDYLQPIMPDVSTIEFDKLYEMMQRDKKNSGMKIGIVLCTTFGAPVGLQFIDRDMLKQAWDTCCANTNRR